MDDIGHRVGIKTPIHDVYNAFATAEGLEGFWTETFEGDPTLGGPMQFFFGSKEASGEMHVDELVPDQLVTWTCAGGSEEWIGTRLIFDLSRVDDETMVLFSHAGWRDPKAFMHHCSTKWTVFLLGLKTSLEGDASGAYPHDRRISNWN